jgi:formylglycine-generating enzyme required for sulfatase activity
MGLSEPHLSELVLDVPETAAWADKNRFRREGSAHILDIASFRIARAPVTVGEYRLFINGNGYCQPRFWTSAGWDWREHAQRTSPDFWNETPWCDADDLPIIGVSWYEAVAYCRWLAHHISEEIRLPSEPEWERSARGDTGWLYPWGRAFDAECCNTRTGNLGRTRAVGEQSPEGDSPFGFWDCVGNVSEWTSSRFLSYPYSHEDKRETLEENGERTTRGGSWHSPDLRACTTSRGMNDPWFTETDLGFRVAANT